jgi:hypothetical protein
MSRVLVRRAAPALVGIVLSLAAGCGGQELEDGDCPDCCCNVVTDAGSCPDAGPAGTPDAGLAAPPEPKLLTNFTEFYDALTTGHDVRAVYHYARCVINGQGPGPNAVGGMDISVFEFFGRGVVGNQKAYVSFSETALILLGQAYVLNYVKSRVYDDGTVAITAQYLDPQTYQTTMHETFECFMANTPDSLEGAFLYQH